MQRPEAATLLRRWRQIGVLGTMERPSILVRYYTTLMKILTKSTVQSVAGRIRRRHVAASNII
jgi:hypothetical protein